jgi:hypothetical protein
MPTSTFKTNPGLPFRLICTLLRHCKIIFRNITTFTNWSRTVVQCHYVMHQVTPRIYTRDKWLKPGNNVLSDRNKLFPELIFRIPGIRSGDVIDLPGYNVFPGLRQVPGYISGVFFLDYDRVVTVTPRETCGN